MKPLEGALEPHLMSTYSQFVFGTEAIRQPVGFPGAEITKHQQRVRQPRAISVTHKRKQRGGRQVRCAHGEKTQRFPALLSDRQCPPANKSDAAKRQDAQKGVREGGGSGGGDCPGLRPAERERRRVRADADTHRETERDEPCLI